MKYLASHQRPVQQSKREIAFKHFDDAVLSRAQIAERLGVKPSAVDTWRKRWRERNFDQID